MRTHVGADTRASVKPGWASTCVITHRGCYFAVGKDSLAFVAVLAVVLVAQLHRSSARRHTTLVRKCTHTPPRYLDARSLCGDAAVS